MPSERALTIKAKKKRRALIFTTIIVLTSIYLSFILIFGEHGLITYLDRKSAVKKMHRDIKTISKQSEHIKTDVDLFENEDLFLIESLAREYGFTKPGEIIYKFKDYEK